MNVVPKVLLRLAAVVLVAALAACANDETRTTLVDEAGDHEALHIHGIGLDPDDNGVYVATHGGLLRAAEGDQRLRRVGESQQDLMGFTLLRSDRYLASGHPASDEAGQPSVLGLIESADRGRTWKPVSLYGRADFHAIEASGDRVYGFDGSTARLMVSNDGGRRWAKRKPPAAVYDIAVSPRDANVVVASTEAGVFSSASAGRNWRLLDGDSAGLLAWPRARRLYLVTGDGELRLSLNEGRKWLTMANVGDQPVAFEARSDELFVAFSDGTVRRSSDMGHNWSFRAGL